MIQPSASMLWFDYFMRMNDDTWKYKVNLLERASDAWTQQCIRIRDQAKIKQHCLCEQCPSQSKQTKHTCTFIIIEVMYSWATVCWMNWRTENQTLILDICCVLIMLLYCRSSLEWKNKNTFSVSKLNSLNNVQWLYKTIIWQKEYIRPGLLTEEPTSSQVKCSLWGRGLRLLNPFLICSLAGKSNQSQRKDKQYSRKLIIPTTCCFTHRPPHTTQSLCWSFLVEIFPWCHFLVFFSYTLHKLSNIILMTHVHTISECNALPFHQPTMHSTSCHFNIRPLTHILLTFFPSWHTTCSNYIAPFYCMYS